MKKLINILALVLIFTSIGCNKDEVTSSFKFTVGDLATGQTINFQNTSSNAVKFEWDFGNGYSEEEYPSHIFYKRGTYEVKLKTYGIDGDNSVSTQDIRIGGRVMHVVNFNKFPSLSNSNALSFELGQNKSNGESYKYYIGKYAQWQLPLKGWVNFEYKVFLTDEEWFWTLYDGSNPMETIYLNPTRQGFVDIAGTGGGFFTVRSESGKTEIYIGWKVFFDF